ncbi:SipW-dependent-type signal peptide-containing protein [Candidatus Parcubacteria bacterium]|nr:SipW-dependent-type signal peptide-containing protein [Candidatus Parcubacteria bacterium]
MNKNILISLAIIGLVAAVAVTGTIAYFSDTETSPNNKITAGALDLTVNGYNNPAFAVVTIDDMKPSQTWYSGPITLTVHNNPGDLYKHIVKKDMCCVTVDVTEPECTDQKGTWTEGATPGTGECTSMPYGDNDYLPEVTWFDLEVWVDDNGDGVIDEDEWDVIIADGTVTVDEIASYWIYLGRYGKDLTDNEITIRQSFHMDKDAGNEYQSDSCTFSEEFMVLQTNAPHPDDVVNVYETGTTLCTDGIDNDFDGFIDCVCGNEDPGCGCVCP